MISNNSAAAIEKVERNLNDEFHKDEEKQLNLINVEFHKAIANNNIDEMEKLLDNGADVNSLNHENESALFVAIRNNFFKIYAHLILLSDVDLNLDGQAVILLQLVCRKNNLNAFTLLHLYKPDIYSVDVQGGTILHYCAQYNSHSICKYLLDKKYTVDVNKRVEYRSLTALQVACLHSSFDVIQLLCEHKDIDVDAVDSFGCTAFHIACSYDKNIEIVRYFIDKIGVDLNVKDLNNESPFVEACTMKAYKISEELLSYDHINFDKDDINVQKFIISSPSLFSWSFQSECYYDFLQETY